jgi:hypothetical protein
MGAIHDFFGDLPPAAQVDMVAALEAKGAAQSFFKSLAPEDRQAFTDARRAVYAHAAVLAAGQVGAHPGAQAAGGASRTLRGR